MTEAQFQAQVVQLAKMAGWLVHAERPAQTGRGWRTPIQGHAGFFDLVLIRSGQVLFVELKSRIGQLRPEQREWFAAVQEHLTVGPGMEPIPLTTPRVRAFCWRPVDELEIIKTLTRAR